MTTIHVLLAGESWVSTTTHVKGYDYFSSTQYAVGVEFLAKALPFDRFTLHHMPGHLVPTDFPMTLDALAHYDVVILSDIGANSLLLHPDTAVHGLTTPNRLKLLQTWVEQGGGLAMCGGYLSFAGMNACAKYFRTPIEAILPVNLHTFDDRVETPEGAQPEVIDRDHPIVRGIGTNWPALLGYNELILKPDTHLIARVGEHPLLATRQVGNGRSFVWASDIGPHWCPPPFLHWEGYARLWQQVLMWLAGR